MKYHLIISVCAERLLVNQLSKRRWKEIVVASVYVPYSSCALLDSVSVPPDAVEAGDNALEGLPWCLPLHVVLLVDST